MHDHTALTSARLTKYLRDLIKPALYADAGDLDVTAWVAPGEPVPFAEAVRQRFEPFALPGKWGRPWGTVWFHLTGVAPSGPTPGTRLEALVDLGFDPTRTGFQCEGAVFTPDGTIVKALNPRNHYVPLDQVSAGGRVDFFVEAAANPDLGTGHWTTASPLGDLGTAGSELLYEFRSARVASRSDDVYELIADLDCLDGLRQQLPRSSRAADILEHLEAALDRIEATDVRHSARSARAVLAPMLAAPASASAPRVHAVGNSHIDSAWLWPTRESRRKCRRTFANALALIDEDPSFIFACSAAQHFAWVEQDDPELFRRVQAAAAAGRFLPVGSMWVEPDMNLVGSESLARQLIMGKRYFLDRFGEETLCVWLPDTFGYSAALPQLIRAAGAEWFVTQKISWNDTNRLPHNTFAWEGIDGTRVFAHFPPADSYDAVVSPAEVARSERGSGDLGRAHDSLLLFGYGDGGGGPTREMLALARRQANLDGSPRVILDTPEDFRASAERDYPDLPVWQGELYLEFHRGTLTSQSRTKKGNRRVESLLREAELWCATAAVRCGAAYPAAQLEQWWRDALLMQFHDVLPGTSIAWVRGEAESVHARLAAELEACVGDALAALTGPGQTPIRVSPAPVPDGQPAMGAVEAEPGDPAPVTRVESRDGVWTLDNDRLRVVVDADGLVTSIVRLADGREVVPSGARANVLQSHRDIPSCWDAWDIERHDVRAPRDLAAATSVTVADGAILVDRAFGASTVRQTIALAPGADAVDFAVDIDWHERQTLLKVAFPLDVHATSATSEIQFGHVSRPISQNTSWDEARFETVAHRWIHVAEPGFGVAIVNDSTYGHSVDHDSDGRGRTSTRVRLSLLRAPVFPDPQADQGRHTFRYRLVVGASIADAIEHGYRLNIAPRRVLGDHGFAPLCTCGNPGVIVETVKLADDGSGDLVTRLYEAHGARAVADVAVAAPVRAVSRTDLLERELEPLPLEREAAGGRVRLELRPFAVVTLRWRRDDG